MTTYIALLYSINVGKNQRVDMQGLRQLAENAGMLNARTVGTGRNWNTLLRIRGKL